MRPHIALDTLDIIGRHKELEAIKQAIDSVNPSDKQGIRVLMLRGPGGIGKTRLLRETVDMARAKGMLCSGIVDLYHSDTRSAPGIEKAILFGSANAPQAKTITQTNESGGIDPAGEYFHTYWKQCRELETLRNKGVALNALKLQQQDLTDLFVETFNALAAHQAIVITLDTIEVVQFESDLIQRMYRLDPGAAEVKAWLVKVLPRLQNSVIILAGRGATPDRPHAQRQALWSDITSAFAGQVGYREFDLDSLEEEDTVRYFNAVAQAARRQAQELRQESEDLRRQNQLERADLCMEKANGRDEAAKQIDQVDDEKRRRIHHGTEGRPIRLGLTVDLLVSGDISGLFDQANIGWNSLLPLIINRIQGLNLGYPVDDVLDYLACTQRGLNAELLRYLESGWSIEDCRKRLDAMQTLSFVKPRAGTDLIFLHDEMYDLLNEHLVWKQENRFHDLYGRVIKYYQEQQSRRGLTSEKQEDIEISLVHYQLRHNPRAGYESCYRLDERAIKEYKLVLDLRLRDEILNFFNEPHYEQIARNEGLSAATVNRDNVLRSLESLLAQNDYTMVAQLVERILGEVRYLGTHASEIIRGIDLIEMPTTVIPQNFSPFFDTVDPYFWAPLLTHYGEALLYLGEPEKRIELVLQRAIGLLSEENATPDTGFKTWLRDRILGRAHNNLGYLTWTLGHYGRAAEQTRDALNHLKHAELADERADTLNNLAYLYGLMGQLDLAKTYVNKALELREKQNKRYAVALSHNTRGIIYTMEDHPMWGAKDCWRAKEICEELKELRGIGLAENGLGFALRKQGDQWKMDVYKQQEATDLFTQAENHLKNAMAIFSDRGEETMQLEKSSADFVGEPIRLWEAYNELGSLYCDWGWLTRSSKTMEKAVCHQKALAQYNEAIKFQDKALQLARELKLEFQIVDTLDDLAQTYADRSFLLIEMGRQAEAEQSRQKADSYLDELQTEEIPREFNLLPKRGFGKDKRHGEAYWLSLGKAHLWRGVWLFRDIENGSVTANDKEQVLIRATQQLCLAVAYFQHYSPDAFGLQRTLRYMREFFVERDITPAWANKQIRRVERAYRIKLDILRTGVVNLIDL